MPSTPKRVKYYVRVARPRIETTIIEVEASHDDEAGQRALEKAPQMSEAAWSLQPFDEAAFQSHVETMIAEDELQSHRAAKRDLAAEALSEIETRYLLLMASEDEEFGHLLLQPWFVTDEPDLMSSDLTRDWIASLQDLGLTHMSERLGDLSAGGTPSPSDRILFSAQQPKTRKE